MTTPDLEQTLANLITQNRLTEAHALLVARLKHGPDEHRAWYWLARVNERGDNPDKAVKLLDKALSLAPSPEYGAEKGRLLCLTGRLGEAQAAIASLEPKNISDALTADTLANTLARLGLYIEARRWHEHAILLAPDNPELALNAAIGEKIAGDIKAATTRLTKLLAAHPSHFRAHYSLAELTDKADAPVHIAALQALLANEQSQEAGRYLHHALALELEKTADYDRAFSHFASSKRAAAIRFDAGAHRAFCNYLLSRPPEPLVNTACDARPVFVCGMPRSGTTLLDRLLCQSTELASLGELNDIAMAIRELSDGPGLISETVFTAAARKPLAPLAERYLARSKLLAKNKARGCDKQPFNFYYIDFILAAMPKAKIVLMLREKNDTCIANFRQLYNPQSPFHHYAFALEDIAAFYDDYAGLARHFAAKYPNNVRLQGYEELVEKGEAVMKEIYAFCELPWQADCLEFYKSTDACATASKLQIRRPLNADSIGRWKNYAARLTTG